MAEPEYSSVEAARILTERIGRWVTVDALLAGLRSGRVVASPRRHHSGCYEWSEADLAAAEQALRRDRRRREHRQPAQTVNG